MAEELELASLRARQVEGWEEGLSGCGVDASVYGGCCYGRVVGGTLAPMHGAAAFPALRALWYAIPAMPLVNEYG